MVSWLSFMFVEYADMEGVFLERYFCGCACRSANTAFSDPCALLLLNSSESFCLLISTLREYIACAKAARSSSAIKSFIALVFSL